jgi:hypothetical protein
VHVRPKRLPFFKVGKELKERVNKSFERTGSGATPSSAAAASGAGTDSGW